jgi:molybdopterin molybdotransferase
MRTVAEHQETIRALLAPLAGRHPERISAISAAHITHDRGRVLAADIRSSMDLPPFDNSQMDGYAVRSADVAPGRPLRVAPRIAAGQSIRSLAPGTAAPIMTGAAVPVGADAIIPIEAASPDSFQPDDDARRVVFTAPVAPGSFVRRRGSDVAAGALLLPAGTRLGAAQWAVLAASGITDIDVISRLRVLVVSTGDEVTAPGQALQPGRVYDANGFAMAVAVAECGAEVVEVVTVSDDATVLRAALTERATGADLILTTGGVSKGTFEVVRDVFENGGVTFESVAVQPGGPQGAGRATSLGIPVVAFPGNPVSALVSFELFLRPVLRHLHGLPPRRPALVAPLAAAVESPPGKHQVRRARLDADGRVQLVGGPSSHLLQSYAACTHLVHIPVGAFSLDVGDPVEIWSIDD